MPETLPLSMDSPPESEAGSPLINCVKWNSLTLVLKCQWYLHGFLWISDLDSMAIHLIQMYRPLCGCVANCRCFGQRLCWPSFHIVNNMMCLFCCLSPRDYCFSVCWFSCKKPWHSKAWNLHTFTKASRLEKNVGNDLIVGICNLRSVIVSSILWKKFASHSYKIVNEAQAGLNIF